MSIETQTVTATPVLYAAQDARARLAAAIADESARAEIETTCFTVPLHGYTWWSTRSHGARRVDEPAEVMAMLDRAVEYLLITGAIVRHANHAHLVRFVNP